MALNIVQYNQGLNAALKHLSKEDARRLLPEAVERGAHIDAVLLWMVAEGPFHLSADGRESEWDMAANAFVEAYPLFQTRESLDILLKALKANGDVVEYGGVLDVFERVPTPIRRSLLTPSASMEPSSQKKEDESESRSIFPYIFAALVGGVAVWILKR